MTPNGLVDTVTDANGNVTNYDYDGFDRLSRTFFSDPVSGSPCMPSLPHSAIAPTCASNQKYEELAYDLNGNVTGKRNRSGPQISYGYDDLNRQTSRVLPQNPQGHFGGLEQIPSILLVAGGIFRLAGRPLAIDMMLWGDWTT